MYIRQKQHETKIEFSYLKLILFSVAFFNLRKTYYKTDRTFLIIDDTSKTHKTTKIVRNLNSFF